MICVPIQSTDFICGWEHIKRRATVTFLLDLEDLIELNKRIMIYYLEIMKRDENHDSFKPPIFLVV